jgi:hypothetical protein
MIAMLMKNVNGVDVPLDEADLAQRVIDALPFQSALIVLTNRQLFAALVLTGFITEAEGLAAGRTGAVPDVVDAVFASLPAQDAFLARLTWATMREVPRNHPLISAMVDANLATNQQVDAIFTLGASLP